MTDDRRSGDDIKYTRTGEEHLLMQIGVIYSLAVHNRSYHSQQGPVGRGGNQREIEEVKREVTLSTHLG